MWAFESDTFLASPCFGDVPAKPELPSSNSFEFFSVPCSSQQTGARNNLRPKIKKETLRQEEANNIPEPDVVGSSKASSDDAVGLAAHWTTTTFIPLLLHEDGSIQGKTSQIDFDCVNSQLCVEDLSVREATTGHEVHITCDA